MKSFWDDIGRGTGGHMGFIVFLVGMTIVLIAVALTVTGCASHYIAADKDMSRMSTAQLTLELAKP